MVDDHITFPAAHSIKLSCLQSKQYHIMFQVCLFKNLSPCIRCEKNERSIFGSKRLPFQASSESNFFIAKILKVHLARCLWILANLISTSRFKLRTWHQSQA